MPSVLRILDANANRAREALRVMEEAARFILDDAALAGGLKQLRHDLAAVMEQLPVAAWHRDTPNDVGTSATTSREGGRSNAADVALAAGKRLSEALRALEEYGKTINEQAGQFAPCIEQLRYRAYDMEQQLNNAMAGGRATQWKICVLITKSLCAHHEWFDIAAMVWEAGADCVQLREKDINAREYLKRARQLAGMANRGTLMINDRPDIALLAGADGVHVGQRDLTCAEVRKVVGGQLIVGVSTSRIEEAEQAFTDGADYCGVGPMYTSTTKHKDLIVGPKYLRQFVQWNKLPHVAIGGITQDNIGELVESGASGIAVSSVVCSAKKPGDVVEALRSALPSD